MSSLSQRVQCSNGMRLGVNGSSNGSMQIRMAPTFFGTFAQQLLTHLIRTG